MSLDDGHTHLLGSAASERGRGKDGQEWEEEGRKLRRGKGERQGKGGQSRS